MYLAALVPQKVPLSTYFIATLDGVGGGGMPQKSTHHKTKNLTSPTSFSFDSLEKLVTCDRLDVIRPVYTHGFFEPPDR